MKRWVSSEKVTVTCMSQRVTVSQESGFGKVTEHPTYRDLAASLLSLILLLFILLFSFALSERLSGCLYT